LTDGVATAVVKMSCGAQNLESEALTIGAWRPRRRLVV